MGKELSAIITDKLRWYQDYLLDGSTIQEHGRVWWDKIQKELELTDRIAKLEHVKNIFIVSATPNITSIHSKSPKITSILYTSILYVRQYSNSKFIILPVFTALQPKHSIKLFTSN